MFTLVSNASNVGLVKLVEHLKELSFNMLDCQVVTEHLTRFGARQIPRIRFLNQLEKSLNTPTQKGKWCFSI